MLFDWFVCFLVGEYSTGEEHEKAAVSMVSGGGMGGLHPIGGGVTRNIPKSIVRYREEWKRMENGMLNRIAEFLRIFSCTKLNENKWKRMENGRLKRNTEFLCISSCTKLNKSKIYFENGKSCIFLYTTLRLKMVCDYSLSFTTTQVWILTGYVTWDKAVVFPDTPVSSNAFT